MKKNLLSMCIAASLLAGTILTPASADADKAYETATASCAEHCYGVLPTDEQTLIEHAYTEGDTVYGIQTVASSLPSSVDLSTSPYFPPITSQGSRGTCAAFATTYYQFTYEYNRLNRTPVSTSGFIASPQWTYSHAVGDDGNGGTSASAIYNTLKATGANSLDDVPYNGQDMTSRWPQDFALSAKAAEKRIKEWYTVNIPASTSVITSPSSTELETVKRRLISGNVLEADTDTKFEIKNSSSYGSIVTRVGVKYNEEYDRSLHAMTIVGYNDNVCFDVNGDGVISPSEKGAFKVANSWGSNWENSGYVWVLYDTLNKNSQISGNWQSSFTSARAAAFTCGKSKSYYKFITVMNDTPYVFGKMTLSTGSMSQTGISTEFGNGISSSMTNTAFYNVGGYSPFSGTIAFPYYSVTDISGAICGCDWGFTVKDSTNDSKVVSGMSYSLVDNLGNTIIDFGSYNNTVNNTAFTDKKTMNLIVGDVDYSTGLSSDDALMVLQSVNGVTELSNLQKYLGDFNNDGVVNSEDAQLILDAVVS